MSIDDLRDILQKYIHLKRYCRLVFHDHTSAVFEPAEIRLHDDIWVVVGIEYYEDVFSDVINGYGLNEICRIEEIPNQPVPIKL